MKRILQTAMRQVQTMEPVSKSEPWIAAKLQNSSPNSWGRFYETVSAKICEQNRLWLKLSL
jgi:hypothetical protein